MKKEKCLRIIIAETVKSKYKTERFFYLNILKTTQQSWNRWKSGDRGFSAEKTEILKSLFTPYEWSLVDRVCESISADPAARPEGSFSSYLIAKEEIARYWIMRSDTLFSFSTFESRGEDPLGRLDLGAELKVSVSYEKAEFESGLYCLEDSLIFNAELPSSEVPSSNYPRLIWFESYVNNNKF